MVKKKKPFKLLFKIGDIIVYPTHGVGTINLIEKISSIIVEHIP